MEEPVFSEMVTPTGDHSRRPDYLGFSDRWTVALLSRSQLCLHFINDRRTHMLKSVSLIQSAMVKFYN